MERLVKAPWFWHVWLVLVAANQRFAWMMPSSRRGPGVDTERPESRRARTNGVDAGVEAATQLPRAGSVERVGVLDDTPERSGSGNRHDDVRESESQDSHSQVVASE